ncbi:hypothetical protein [Comamonas jiangduensis]|jgi:hypothetical protein
MGMTQKRGKGRKKMVLEFWYMLGTKKRNSLFLPPDCADPM